MVGLGMAWKKGRSGREYFQDLATEEEVAKKGMLSLSPIPDLPTKEKLRRL